MGEEKNRDEPQATHRLQLSERAFKALVLAIYRQSLREMDICSPRRLLTVILKDEKSRILALNDRQLDQLCKSDVVIGRMTVNIRIDSSVNAQMRRLREHAEQRLGRPVSVAEAVYVCCKVANLE